MIGNLVAIHHIGIVVKSLEKMKQYYLSLGYSEYSDAIFETEQGVNVQFLKLGETLIELIEPAKQNSPVDKFLKKGGGLHHLCYLTQNMEETIKDFRNYGAVLVCKPYKSPTIKNCMVSFIVTKEGELIELAEIYE